MWGPRRPLTVSICLGSLLCLRAATPLRFVLFLLPWAEAKPDRRPTETKCLTQHVLEEALVREVHQVWVVDEEDEGGRGDRRLRPVIHAELVSLVRRRRVRRDGPLHHFVELPGRDATLTLALHADRLVQHALHALPGERRD